MTETDESSPLIKSDSGTTKTNGTDAIQNDTVDSPLAIVPLGATAVKNKTEEKEKFAFRRLTRRNKLVIVLLSMANFFTGCGYSLLAPFFPQELTRIGPKFLFVSGILVGGSCSILFGILDKSPSGLPFIIICFACRSVEALGLSALITSSLAIISNEFPKHVATVFGFLETSNGIGLMAGPAIGGFLYEAGGYGLPFFVIGSAVLATGMLMFFILPVPHDGNFERKGSLLKLLMSPIVWFSSIGILASSIAIVYLDPIFANYLEKFNLSTSTIGLIFVIAPGLYGLTSPLWGYISDRTGYNPPMIILGNLMCGIAFLLIGPAPFLSFLPVKLWVIIIGLVITGTFFGATVVPSMKCLLIGALEVGFEDNLDTNGVVSGLFVSVFSIGSFISPMMAGVLVDEIGFRNGAIFVSGINFCVMILSSIFFTLRWYRRPSLADDVYVRYDSIVPQAMTNERVEISFSAEFSKTKDSHP
uniref:Major facilitator superfamily (MFS) profile domain-containing protein n=1 Tax=Biomphalaria glabrata TaxID=6526 RepID=A0A2C9LCB3_BIOGL